MSDPEEGTPRLDQFIPLDCFQRFLLVQIPPLYVYKHAYSGLPMVCAVGEYKGALMGSIVWTKHARAKNNDEVIVLCDQMLAQFIGQDIYMRSSQPMPPVRRSRHWTAFLEELCERMEAICLSVTGVALCNGLCKCPNCSATRKRAIDILVMRSARLRAQRLLTGKPWPDTVDDLHVVDTE